MLLVGGEDGNEYLDTIFEHDMEQDTMQEIGNMQEARGRHAVSVVQYSDFSQWCQS